MTYVKTLFEIYDELEILFKMLYWLVSFYQVTRSIGDDDLKPAVTAEPEITETILSVEDEFLVNHYFDE